MAPRHTAVITGSASRDGAIGPESRRTSAVAAPPRPRLAGAEKFLVCNELRCLSKDGPLPRRALYEERSECDDQPQRSGYVQVARVDSIPGKWWVWSEFLLRARRGNEADRRRTRPLPAVLPEARISPQRVSAHRGKNLLHDARHLMGSHQPLLTRVTPG